MVQARVVFNSFTPVPSESLALSAITSLLSSRFTNLTDTLKVLNVTYQRISNTSYALIFNISISNISISENREIENTYSQVENAINNALNTLLNAPNADPFTPKSSNYTLSGKQIGGEIEYSFQNGDTKNPVNYLSELQKQSGIYTSGPPSTSSVPLLSSTATPKTTTGSAMVQARVVFNSFTPVPSESLALSAITSLLSSRFTNLTDTLKVLNVTYHRISNTSYALIFNISISNISISENREIENTYSQVENAINNALNTLLNAPNADPFTPKSSNYTLSGKQIGGEIEYSFQNGDTKNPVNYLSELQKQSGIYTSGPPSTSSVPLLSSTATPKQRKIISDLTGSAMVQARVVFNSFTPVPSESLALSAITSLLSSRFTNLTDTLKVLNVTYHRISNTSYALIFNISISNISISENREIENNTYSQVENAINNAVSVHARCSSWWL
ncbi:mucin-5AC-like [Silurus meridionalis]|uniref:mucin-5AC-like n=1 Tax=Silurus meridionalis TaxID=175797 RepID=UPI001EEA4D53|nr:mucin-5AC-like [Silurus meridionalis]